MANSRPDYVHVQLTPAGVAFAGGVPLRVSGIKRSFLFTGDTAQEVEKSAEWRGILSRQTTADGTALFQLAPDPTPLVAPTASTAKTPAPAPAKTAAAAPATEAEPVSAAPTPAAK